MPIRGAPGTGINTIRNPLSPLAPDSLGKVRVSQQSLEIISDSGDSRARLSQQFLEIVHGGGDNRIRLSEQFIEVIHTFGTPPQSPPGKKQPPGQTRKDANFIAKQELRRVRREVRRIETDATAFIPAQYLSPGPGSSMRGVDAIDWRRSTRRISTSPSGHTVRKQ